jgi:hypothetical protein
VNAAELSTIDWYWDSDLYKDQGAHAMRYEVMTVSRNDVLAQHNTPKEIAYLSIDTEGTSWKY